MEQKKTRTHLVFPYAFSHTISVAVATRYLVRYFPRNSFHVEAAPRVVTDDAQDCRRLFRHLFFSFFKNKMLIFSL